MAYRLSARYQDATIVLAVDALRNVQLEIDGVTRASAQCQAEQGAGCYLVTTLQTAYEYHSLVEAWMRATGDASCELLIKIAGNELARQRFSTPGRNLR